MRVSNATLIELIDQILTKATQNGDKRLTGILKSVISGYYPIFWM